MFLNIRLASSDNKSGVLLKALSYATNQPDKLMNINAAVGWVTAAPSRYLRGMNTSATPNGWSRMAVHPVQPGVLH